MLSADEVLSRYYLDTRCALIEIAAMLDRYDRAARTAGANGSSVDPRLEKLQAALDLLARKDTRPQPDRSEQLLLLFSDLT